MTTINAYLFFNGKCREAMNFYKECLGGGELHLQEVGGSPAEPFCPAAMKDQILHSSLVKGGIMLMGSDMSDPTGAPAGTAPASAVALSVNCSSEEEINSFFNKLSEGGRIIDPLKEQFWGAIFGVLTDKYGIRWMFNYDKNSKQ